MGAVVHFTWHWQEPFGMILGRVEPWRELARRTKRMGPKEMAEGWKLQLLPF
jgi:hypothetical protein